MNITTKQKVAGTLKSEDEMIQEITIVDNKVSNLPLMDGTYTIIVLSNKERTYNEWLQYYNAIVDTFCLDTGNKRGEIHKMFKELQGIVSTKELNDKGWQLYINEFKKWCLVNS